MSLPNPNRASITSVIYSDCPQVLLVVTHCHPCAKEHLLHLHEDAFRKWCNGQLIQEAFPHLSSDDRERLISGTCPACWAKLFGE